MNDLRKKARSNPGAQLAELAAAASIAYHRSHHLGRADPVVGILIVSPDEQMASSRAGAADDVKERSHGEVERTAGARLHHRPPLLQGLVICPNPPRASLLKLLAPWLARTADCEKTWKAFRISLGLFEGVRIH